MSARPQSRDNPAASARIEPMDEADLDAVMQIEQLSFRLPWSRQVFLEELGRPWAFLDVVRVPAEPRDRRRDKAVPERGRPRVLAFCNYWRVADEVHILKVAVHPDARRSGFGSRLLSHMLDFSRRSSARLVTLEVRRSNDVAQRLYRRFGFRSVGLRPNYYADDNEDALVMLLDL
jgi:[ribosomal protein S18]-alanine N-acetyltransferase